MIPCLSLLVPIAIAGCAHQSASGAEQPQTATASTAAAEPAAPATIETKEVMYDSGTTKLKGFIAYPAVAGKRPAVLVVHEWWGPNDYVRMRAKKLAEMGYVGFAVDMYGDGKVANHPDDAKKFMMEVMSNLDEGAKRFQAAQALLAADPRVDATKIAAIGYCFGGAVVLHMARIGTKLDAVASFHGNLATQSPMKPGAYAGQILIATGGSDPFVPPEQVDAAKKELDAAGAHYELTIYPNAKHAFTNPDATATGQKFGLPLEYNAQADAASWQQLDQLLAKLWPRAS
jgi:dienelactone hydrolase